MTSPSTISPARLLRERSALQAVFFDLDGTLADTAPDLGMKTLVARFGYIEPNEDTAAWGADGEAHAPADIVRWLRSWTV